MTDIAQALANPAQPEATFAAVAQAVQETIGATLFTLTEIDHARAVARRRYSTQAEAYPVSGEKPTTPDAWTAQVLDRHQIFVANSIEEIAAVFPDYELIQSLGCESCLNLPVVIGGQVIGTLNCLHEAGHYTPERVAAAPALAPLGALAFLMAARFPDPADQGA